MVWIESITTRAASPADWRLAAMSRRLIAAASSSGASCTPRRRARRRVCSIDSSPDMYKTRRPSRARAAAACSSSVDLPMPGSPPTRIAEAGTRPPPRTRSNSAMPVGRRGGGSAVPARSTNATRRPAPPLAAGPGRGAIASSTMVFHSPQASQRPTHRGLTPPQLWQTKREVGLANGRQGRLAVSMTWPLATFFTVLTSSRHSRSPREATYSRCSSAFSWESG